jgi:hypothetical protein
LPGGEINPISEVERSTKMLKITAIRCAAWEGDPAAIAGLENGDVVAYVKPEGRDWRCDPEVFQKAKLIGKAAFGRMFPNAGLPKELSSEFFAGRTADVIPANNVAFTRNLYGGVQARLDPEVWGGVLAHLSETERASGNR